MANAIDLLDSFFKISEAERLSYLASFLEKAKAFPPYVSRALSEAAPPSYYFGDTLGEIDDTQRQTLLVNFLRNQEEREIALSVVPANTALTSDELHQLVSSAIAGFEGKIGEIRMLEPVNLTEGDRISYFKLNTLLATDFDDRLLIAYTDAAINVADTIAGGFGQRATSRAAVSTYIIPNSTKNDRERMLRRIIGVTLHELGHLFMLEHHDQEITIGEYCPMTNRTPLEFSTREKSRYTKEYRAFLDSRAAIFCDSCRKKNNTVIEI